MTNPNALNLDDAIEMLHAASLRVAHDWQCKVVMDGEIAEEAVRKAEEHLAAIPGIPEPNPYKVAGCYAFWVRKLKPFRIFRVGAFVEMMEREGIPHSIKPQAAEVVDARRIFINEYAAARLAVAIIQQRGYKIAIKPDLMHDLIVSLRYHSISPNSLRIIFEGMA